MNILVATSEAVPFAKTGGLADVCGALPGELAKLGHDVALIMPAYRQARQGEVPLEDTGVALSVPIGAKTVSGKLLKATLPGTDVPVYLVEQNDYFDREQLYGKGSQDYIDNCERFVFFCRAVLETIRVLEWKIDVIHCNDWQTGLIPAYLKTELAGVPPYEGIASLMTIHNLAYQGSFWHWDMLLTGLDWKHFNWQEMEFFGKLNLLKTGLVFADWLNTVSPRYAIEIQSPPLSCGLEGVLQYRRKTLAGILNGADYSKWNPATDPHLPQQYDASNWQQKKPLCKAGLQSELGLPQDEQAPLLGFVGRLAEQKGIDLIAQTAQQLIDTHNVQWAILGTGDATYHDLFQRLARRAPDKFAVRLEFSDGLAHRIEAGADMFLMPSRYEPCGLNQMYSLKYGTVPVVRATGGLADTIVDATPEALEDRTANGFSFQQYSPLALAEALSRACDAFHDNDVWNQLIETGMSQDWSWKRSAGKYVDLYQKILAHKQVGTRG